MAEHPHDDHAGPEHQKLRTDKHGCVTCRELRAELEQVRAELDWPVVADMTPLRAEPYDLHDPLEDGRCAGCLLLKKHQGGVCNDPSREAVRQLRKAAIARHREAASLREQLAAAQEVAALERLRPWAEVARVLYDQQASEGDKEAAMFLAQLSADLDAASTPEGRAEVLRARDERVWSEAVRAADRHPTGLPYRPLANPYARPDDEATEAEEPSDG